ncbi:MAG: arylsulfatase A-like enzyme [Rhodothermales bacterium]
MDLASTLKSVLNFKDTASIMHIRVLCLFLALFVTAAPNILFISIDDLNDWIGCLGGHPQTKTPNLDAFAARSTLFTNAHCAAASCNPSRTAVMTGISPHRSGLYENGQRMRDVLPDATLLPQFFRNHGYWAGGSGKLLHYFIDARSWDSYFPDKETENPFPRTLYPETRPLSLPRGGPWQYGETDWGPLPATDEEYGGDYLVSEWIGAQLNRKHYKPFFLACGIYRPHEPWFVPAKYFEPFPLDSIQLPAGFREDDLDDLPPAGKRRGPNRYFAHIRAHKQWKQALQGYLASIHFADAMLGRVLDSLAASPHAKNTIVALWSDHGWHLGEKQHWQKFSAWRVCSRVPLIVHVPPKLSQALPAGTQPGISTRPVDLLSLYPTLLQLAGLPPNPACDGPSLLPLLRSPQSEWPHVGITHLGEPGSLGLSADRFRYIRYANGDEELYDIANDPHEWTNLAPNPEYAPTLTKLRARAPAEFAKKPTTKASALPSLRVSPRPGPPSKPDGNPFDVLFINHHEHAVELFWVDSEGKTRSYGQLEPGARKNQQTRPGAVWQFANSATREVLGHITVGDRRARVGLK